ncbi:MAG: hypothetical protein JWP18_1814 [Solirubrobacterales bacterium]|nr:hypothetical protein [Solirubrobacterales bacterium]
MSASFAARLGPVAAGAGLALLLGAGGVQPAQGQSSGRPACFGAAARDTLNPCNNSSLRLKVVPTPDDAVIEPNSPCLPVSLKLQPFVCSFGAVKSDTVKPTATVALMGDSHAAHWRAALDPIAQLRGWAGLSLTRSSCPFSATTPRLAERETRDACVKWNKQVPGWFARHKEVSTVFMSHHIQVRVVAPKGASQFETKVKGYMRKWSALPATVKQVVVIKDTPRATGNTAECVSIALAKKRRAGSACAVPTSFAVAKDPAVEAVRRLNSPRYSAVDLTDFFCSARLCQPVIGGALVYKDPGHITREYGVTLAPYLARALGGLTYFQPPAPAPAG